RLQSSLRQRNDPARPTFSKPHEDSINQGLTASPTSRSRPRGLPFLVAVSGQFAEKAQGSGPLLPMSGLIRILVVMPSGGFLRRMPGTSDVEPGRARFQEGFHGWHAVLTILQGSVISSPWPCWFWHSFSRSG